MGLFSFQQELAIDLGTANTIIIHNEKVVVNEPSIVAIDNHSGTRWPDGVAGYDRQDKARGRRCRNNAENPAAAGHIEWDRFCCG